MKILYFFAFLIWPPLCFSQIRVEKVAPPINMDELNSQPYDSTVNYVGGKVRQYLGQTLFIHKRENFGTDGFLWDFRKSEVDRSNVYLSEGNPWGRTHSDSVFGKYFKVIDVHKPSKRTSGSDNKTCFLQLEREDNKDVLYFAYRIDSEYNFPFLVVGYFKKLEMKFIGQKFVVRGIPFNWNEEIQTEFGSGLPVRDFVAGAIWECSRLIVEKDTGSILLLLKNRFGEEIPANLEFFPNQRHLIPIANVEALKKKYGTWWPEILAGNPKIGMNKDMILFTLGKSHSIKKSTAENKPVETWTYERPSGSDWQIIFSHDKVINIIK